MNTTYSARQAVIASHYTPPLQSFATVHSVSNALLRYFSESKVKLGHSISGCIRKHIYQFH